VSTPPEENGKIARRIGRFPQLAHPCGLTHFAQFAQYLYMPAYHDQPIYGAVGNPIKRGAQPKGDDELGPALIDRGHVPNVLLAHLLSKRLPRL
jgi:hypothetical protein